MLWTRRWIHATPDAAWHLLTDTDRWPEWGPSVADAWLDAPGRFVTGATGSIRTAVGPTLDFTLTDVVPGTRWTWEVAGLPATGHEVVPELDGVTVGFGVPTLAAPYLAVCRVALARIAHALHHETEAQ